MKWITALVIGAILAFVLPTAFDGREGQWMKSWSAWGTIRPLDNSPALLFSIPMFIGVAMALRFVFNWHDK